MTRHAGTSAGHNGAKCGGTVEQIGSFMASIEARENQGIVLIGRAAARQGGVSARLTG